MSDGHLQMLLLLTALFADEPRESLLMLDEPEISLLRRVKAESGGTESWQRILRRRHKDDSGFRIKGSVPYVGLLYSTDMLRSAQGNTPWDRDAFLLTLGVNFFSLKDKITGGIVYSNETGRQHTRNSTLMGNLNIRF